MLQIVCPNCQRALKLPDTAAGQTIHCPRCKHLLRIATEDEPPIIAATHAGYHYPPASSVGPQTVLISARIIHWPTICACCGGHPQSNLAASSFRTTGVRVIRTEGKQFDVPYCNQCILHVHETIVTIPECRDRLRDWNFRIESFQQRLDIVQNPWLLLVGVETRIAAAIGFLFAISTGVFVGVALDPIAGLLLGCAVFGGVFPLAMLCCWRGKWPWQQIAAAEAELDIARNHRQATANELEGRETNFAAIVTPRCVCAAMAVDYDGWSGSVHSFTFQSAAYADAFRSANAAKIVG